ncbi:5-hydroxytryptamine receptor-like [Tetranychus urticae]|uniref:5-hydroxytryptamine receptor-like n=1 Tax=Tetranychus urticae TaxID=32264 RepID=UPI00077BFF26|nr:5-hydroxytryptamine receptor-like [Tetranychus urticae]
MYTNVDPTSDLSSSPSPTTISYPVSTSFHSSLLFNPNVSTEVRLHQSSSASFISPSSSFSSSPFTIAISSALGVLIFCTILGNIFVIYAILFDRILRRVGNYLVLSLAIADFMVACTVMPISAFYEVTGEWTFGSFLCEIWISADVLCCTASILHLLAIALDRYWAVTRVNHIKERDLSLVGKMITAVWTVSLLVSLAPVLGWKDPHFLKRLEEEKTCLISQDIAYQIFATVSSFYAPLVVILFLYWKIYKVKIDIFRLMITSIIISTSIIFNSNSNHKYNSICFFCLLSDIPFELTFYCISKYQL